MGAAPDAGPWTVARLLAWTREYLTRYQVESPRLCSEILLAHALGCERLRLFTQYESVPADEALAKFRTAVKQAAAGQPIAYLTGVKEFFALTFEVTPDVLIPRPETEILVERLVHLARHGGLGLASLSGAAPQQSDAAPPARVLDLCTGSGCIAVALAKHLPQTAIAASDISAAALAVAQRNATRHAVADRITFASGDLFAPWDGAAPFDALVSNPPYIAETEWATLPRNVREHEPRAALAGGPDGLDVIRRIIAEAPRHLAAGGHLLLEIGHTQAPLVTALLDGPEWRDIVTYRDGGGHQRVIHARRPAAASTQCG
jgi:release factor glutamine methyltransferase